MSGTFWSMIVKPGKEVEIEFPDTMTLNITSVSLGLIPKKKANTIVRLFSNVQTIHMSDEMDISDTKFEESRTLIATLVPGEKEYQNLNLIFSPLNITKFEVTGKLPVNIIGNLAPIEDDNDLNDEEEEEQEEQFIDE